MENSTIVLITRQNQYLTVNGVIFVVMFQYVSVWCGKFEICLLGDRHKDGFNEVYTSCSHINRSYIWLKCRSIHKSPWILMHKVVTSRNYAMFVWAHKFDFYESLNLIVIFRTRLSTHIVYHRIVWRHFCTASNRHGVAILTQFKLTKVA